MMCKTLWTLEIYIVCYGCSKTALDYLTSCVSVNNYVVLVLFKVTESVDNFEIFVETLQLEENLEVFVNSPNFLPYFNLIHIVGMNNMSYASHIS
jgi:hypothetical protein